VKCIHTPTVVNNRAILVVAGVSGSHIFRLKPVVYKRVIKEISTNLNTDKYSLLAIK
jgi:hypothetical protein